jgi:hypothetical protein
MSFQSFLCLVPSVHKLQFIHAKVSSFCRANICGVYFLWVLCWRFSAQNNDIQSQITITKTYEQIMEPSYPHPNHRYWHDRAQMLLMEIIIT